VTADTIAANAISSGKIAAGAVTTTSLAAGAITADKIAANAITAGQIAAGAISTAELAADAITADKIAAGAITANEIAANAVTAGKIAADSVTADKIAANAVTAGSIAANAVTAGVIAAGAISGDLGHIADLSVDTLQIKGQAVTVAATIWKPNRRTYSSSSTWVSAAKLGLTKESGFQTELSASFAYDGAGTAVILARILRGTTVVGTCAFTTGEKGSQMQGTWVFLDTNTASGAVTYSLEFKKGSWAGNSFNVNAWNVRFKGQQVLR